MKCTTVDCIVNQSAALHRLSEAQIHKGQAVLKQLRAALKANGTRLRVLSRKRSGNVAEIEAEEVVE